MFSGLRLPPPPPRRGGQRPMDTPAGLPSSPFFGAVGPSPGGGGSRRLRIARAVSSLVNSGTGGSRGALRRLPPVPGLDAEERVQADAPDSPPYLIKSFAELPVLLDEQFSEECGNPQNIDLLLSNTPHFFTTVLNWLGSSESQHTVSEVLAGITSPVDAGFFCKSADSSTMYASTSMICCADESCVCFARDDEDKWLIYDFETVETEDTWEHLLGHFKHCKSGARLQKLDAGSPQTTKIKSFAQLPVLLDEQCCKDSNCNDNLLLSNAHHFCTIVLNWLVSSESQDTLSEVLAVITSPVDTGFFCRTADSSTMYTVTSMDIRSLQVQCSLAFIQLCLHGYDYVQIIPGLNENYSLKDCCFRHVLPSRTFTDHVMMAALGTALEIPLRVDQLYAVTSMICCVDESYVCFARDDEDKWLIHGFETVETEDTWEHLVERFKDCKLQPEVLFFEVIK